MARVWSEPGSENFLAQDIYIYDVRQQGGARHDRRSPGLDDIVGAFRPRQGDASAKGEMDLLPISFFFKRFPLHALRRSLKAD